MGRLVHCCTCSKWVHLRCSLLSFSRFKTLGSSHSYSCPPCFFWRSLTYQHCILLFGLHQLVYIQCSTWLIWPLLYQFNAPVTPLPSYFLHPAHLLIFLDVFLYLLLPLPLPDWLKVLQMNTGGLRGRSTELLHFISSHPVDLICIQEPILNSSCSF